MSYGTAVHEAAHAVIGRVVGLKCGAVDIIETEEDYGGAHIEPVLVVGWPDELVAKRRLLTAYCVAFASGREAERELTGQDDYVGCRDDYRKIRHYCAYSIKFGLPERNTSRHLRHVRRLSLALVKKHRIVIEQVATSLIERKSLSGQEVDRLMAVQTLNNGFPLGTS